MESDSHKQYFLEAAKEAQKSLCLRKQGGAVIVKNGTIIGRGYNAPPNDNIASRKCERNLTNSSKIRSDRTCCIHAEWRAIIDALRHHPNLADSTIYFTRIDKEGNIVKSGEPYCTVCSRLALDVGIAYFTLWHEGGIRLYDSKEYNELSYAFHQKLEE